MGGAIGATLGGEESITALFAGSGAASITGPRGCTGNEAGCVGIATTLYVGFMGTVATLCCEATNAAASGEGSAGEEDAL